MKYLLALILTLSSVHAMASAQSDIDFILQAKNPPKGVVFEIATGDENALSWALSQIDTFSKKLREKNPNLDIAVVSHGQEEYALLSENAESASSTHNAAKALVQEKIPVHVCNTHASMRNKTASDFPSYVSVVETGPKQIRDYQRKGYALVRLNETENIPHSELKDHSHGGTM